MSIGLQKQTNKKTNRLFTKKLLKEGGIFGMNEINMKLILNVFLSTALKGYEIHPIKRSLEDKDWSY